MINASILRSIRFPVLQAVRSASTSAQTASRAAVSPGVPYQISEQFDMWSALDTAEEARPYYTGKADMWKAMDSDPSVEEQSKKEMKSRTNKK